MRILALGIALLLAAAPSLTAQVTIGAPGGSEVRSWGKPDTQTYGQTITSPGGVLNSFSFWLGRTSPISDDPTPDLDFRAYVYEWVDSRAAGSALYSSAITNHSTDESAGFTRYDFNVGALALNPGDMYVLFLSTSGLAGSGRIFWEASLTDGYGGGNYVFLNNGEDTGMWTSTAWSSGLVPDLRFEATFDGAVVPEPASITLLALGLFGVAFVRRRRPSVEMEA